METIKHFSIYYINFEKVFEIAMLLDNKEVVTIQEDTGSDHKVRIGAKIQATMKLIYSAFAEGGYEFNSSKQTKKTIEMKYTNAIFLRSIINEIEDFQKTKLSQCKEGQLVIEDVKLRISNEEEMRQMSLVKRGLLDKFVHEDISIGQMMKTLAEDYSYVLTSNLRNKRILIKIPTKLENEFENNYTIDDILNGTTTVIGVYRGKRKLEDFKSTFQYITNSEQNELHESVQDDGIIQSADVDNSDESDEDKEYYHYLDVLAVIQRIVL